MPLIDIILLIIIASFGMFGLWFGLIHTLGSLIGTIAGIYLATRFYEPMAGWLANITGWGGNVPKVVMFIIAFIVINRLVGFVFWIIDKVLSLITRLPFIAGINRFMGFIFGLLEGIITLGMIIYFIERFPLSAGIMQKLTESSIAPRLSGVIVILLPLLPEALKMLKSTVDYTADYVQKAVENVNL